MPPICPLYALYMPPYTSWISLSSSLYALHSASALLVPSWSEWFGFDIRAPERSWWSTWTTGWSSEATSDVSKVEQAADYNLLCNAYHFIISITMCIYIYNYVYTWICSFFRIIPYYVLTCCIISLDYIGRVIMVDSSCSSVHLWLLQFHHPHHPLRLLYFGQLPVLLPQLAITSPVTACFCQLLTSTA